MWVGVTRLEDGIDSKLNNPVKTESAITNLLFCFSAGLCTYVVGTVWNRRWLLGISLRVPI